MFKQQLQRLKENWLLLLIIILILAVFNFSSVSQSSFNKGVSESFLASDMAYGKGIVPYQGNDFAPDVQERKLTKDANLNLEIERNDFSETHSKVKSIISNNGAILLNENTQKLDSERKAYSQAYYQIKVPTSSYLKILEDLNSLGETLQFSENTQDITGEYLSLQDELSTEKKRLERYQQLFSQTTSVSDKITIEDRIFDQERRIAYIESLLTNQDRRLDYSTIYLTLTEERSEYINLAFVKFSALIISFVNSINNLLSFIFAVIPYLIGISLIIWIVKYFKRR